MIEYYKQFSGSFSWFWHFCYQFLKKIEVNGGDLEKSEYSVGLEKLCELYRVGGLGGVGGPWGSALCFVRI